MRAHHLLPTLLVLGCASSGPSSSSASSAAVSRDGVPRPGQGAALIELRKLPPPAHIPLEVRVRIAERMERHGAAMSQIWHSVVLLDFETASDAAFALEREPALGRPLSRDDETLAAHLPEAFFELQDELAERARTFAMSSVTEDPNVIATRLAALGNTCISCHTVYLKDPEAK